MPRLPRLACIVKAAGGAAAERTAGAAAASGATGGRDRAPDGQRRRWRPTPPGGDPRGRLRCCSGASSPEHHAGNADDDEEDGGGGCGDGDGEDRWPGAAQRRQPLRPETARAGARARTTGREVAGCGGGGERERMSLFALPPILPSLHFHLGPVSPCESSCRSGWGPRGIGSGAADKAGGVREGWSVWARLRFPSPAKIPSNESACIYASPQPSPP
eukprot:scaffold306_cov525-Prasinococcus_capsulatus_cf.AAC.66